MNSDKDTIINDLNSARDYLSEILTDLKKLFTYKGFVDLYEFDIDKEEYRKNIEKIKTLDKDALENKLNDIKTNLINYIEDVKYNWDSYNINYKKYLAQKIKQLLTELFNIKFRNENKYDIKEFVDYCYNNNLQILKLDIKSTDLIEIFSRTNRNYVIFGKNGAGKTRLLNYVKNNYFNTNAYIMPSNRNIEFGKLNNIHVDYSDKTNLTNVFVYESYKGFPNDYLNIMLKDKDHDELKNGNFIKDNITNEYQGKTLNRFISIFNSLSLDRKVKLKNSADARIMLYGDDIPEYYASEASDGEKSIIQFILFILFCPLHSFVFIDEPETHLNNALLSELFTILEQERNDIIFIYCTHNIDFIETRENVKLIFLNKYMNNKWDIEGLESYDEIPLNVIIDIIGTKKDILFIEGDYSSIDYKIYSILFSNFKLIPVFSCQKVIENCRSINLFNRRYFGIVDNDFRTDDEIRKLNEQNIDVIKYNEIENMILSSEILEYVANKINANDKIEIVKQSIVKKANTGKNGIIQDYINKVFSKYQKSDHLTFSDIDSLESSIKKLNEDNCNNFIKDLSKFIKDLNVILDKNDYDSIIKNLPNKGFISSLTELDITKERYLKILMMCLNEDKEFKSNIIKNNFSILKEIEKDDTSS